MFGESNSDGLSKPTSLIRRLLPWLGVLVVIGIIYDGSVFYSRWSANKAAEQNQQEKQTEGYKAVAKMAGGDELSIRNFYAAPGIVRSGEPTKLCYGVNEAKTVRLDPPVDEVWPALSRCVQATPRHDTTYTLTAEDAAGHSVSKTVTVKVQH